MEHNSPTMIRVLAASVSVARRAGSIIQSIHATGKLDVVEKTSWNDVQTAADRAAQRCIVTSLLSNFPKLRVIGEEDLTDNRTEDVETALSEEVVRAVGKDVMERWSSVKEEDIVVWVDPLDGTKEFTEDLLDHTTVLIGLAVGGRAVGGVIHQPWYGYRPGGTAPGSPRTIWGLEGLSGVQGLGGVTETEGRVVTTTRSHNNKYINEMLDAVAPDSVLRVGGSGNKLLQVLDGVAKAYVFPSPGTKKWDTCAGDAILRTAGGRLTDVFGADIVYDDSVERMNGQGLLATRKDHQWYLDRVPQGVKDALAPK